MDRDSAILEMQKGEITEHRIYLALAKRTKDAKNRKILEEIAGDELKHYGMLKKITGRDVSHDALAEAWYTLISSVFGLSFGLKLMENGELKAQLNYGTLMKEWPELEAMLKDEEKHEEYLLGMLSEERLEYASSIVLGLNDAIVEFTGTLAGLTFAIADSKIIGITGLIMGVAASLSMGASAYLSAKEDEKKNPAKSFIYTAGAYMLTVLIIISPYFLLQSVQAALAVLLALTLAIVAGYSFYITTAKSQNFWEKFEEMIVISFGVALISFVIGLALKEYVGSVE